MMELTKFKVNKAKALEIMDYYKATEINDTNHPYDLFIHKTKDGIVVKGFKTKNPDVFTITFFGADGKASLEASIFMPNVKVETSSLNIQISRHNLWVKDMKTPEYKLVLMKSESEISSDL